MAKDYTDIGLDNNLNAANGLAATAPRFTTATQFDANYEQGISAIKIPDTFQIIQKGTVSVHKVANQTFNNNAISHNLGYAPMVLAFTDASVPGSVSIQVPFLDFDSTTGALQQMYYLTANTTNINFFIQTPVTSGQYASDYTAIFKYYFLRESAGTV